MLDDSVEISVVERPCVHLAFGYLYPPHWVSAPVIRARLPQPPRPMPDSRRGHSLSSHLLSSSALAWSSRSTDSITFATQLMAHPRSALAAVRNAVIEDATGDQSPPSSLSMIRTSPGVGTSSDVRE
jgi:hypothetical protein